MNIWIDDQQIATAQSIEEAFDLARQHTENTGRLIVDIIADGQAFDDQFLDDMPDETAGIQELKMTTADLKVFLSETVSSAKEALQLTKEDQNSAADQIRAGELSNSVELLSAVIEGWQAVRDVIDQSAALAGIDIESLALQNIKGDTITGDQCIDQLSSALSELRSSLQSQDWAALGDVLEYDLEDQANNWDSLLHQLQITITQSNS